MLWVTWRQHRAELVAALLLLAFVAVPMIVSGVAMHAEYHADGIAACVADPGGRSDCGEIVDRFVDRYIEWANRLVWVAFLPALAGVFIGAPMLAREFETGTWKLAFTQSVTRTRWLATSLGIVVAAVAVLGLLFAMLFTWWRSPLNAISGSMRSTAFMAAPLSLAASSVFAFALGAFFGALIRRTIAAMAATLAVYVAIRIPLEEAGRPGYLTPLTRITDPSTNAAADWRPATEWVVSSGWVDSAGRRLSDAEEWEIMNKVYDGNHVVASGGTPVEQYLAEHGLRHYTEYHPLSAFWPMQFIEAALFLGTAAVLLTAAIWMISPGARRQTVKGNTKML